MTLRPLVLTLPALLLAANVAAQSVTSTSDGLVAAARARDVSAAYGLDPETSQAVVIVQFSNPRRILRPGMTVMLTGFED